MTKTEIQNAINNALSIVITKAKVLAGLDNIVNELYSTPKTENYTAFLNTLDVLQNSDTDVWFELILKKTGNQVTINGYVKNMKNIIHNGSFAVISNIEYQQLDLSKQYGLTNSNEITLYNNNIVITNLGVGEKRYLQLTYITN